MPKSVDEMDEASILDEIRDLDLDRFRRRDMTEDEMFAYGVLRLAQDLRMDTFDAADRFSERTRGDIERYLWKRLGRWYDSSSRSGTICAPCCSRVHPRGFAGNRKEPT